MFDLRADATAKPQKGADRLTQLERNPWKLQINFFCAEKILKKNEFLLSLKVDISQLLITIGNILFCAILVCLK